MTKQELKENGITITVITRAMHRLEKIISYYNKKYDYDLNNAANKERAEYNSAIVRWDVMKAHRDILKAN